MSRLLVDTHVLIWLLGAIPKLGQKQIEVLQKPDIVIHVSAVSIFEMLTKHRIGKLKLPTSFLADTDSLFEDFSFAPLALTPRHAAVAGKLEGTHKDPFDRLLAAQSMVERIPVMTTDAEIGALGAQVVW